MPRFTRYKGIVIYFFFEDKQKHHLPHFHAYYAEFEASIGLNGKVLSGYLPAKQLKTIQKLLEIHHRDFQEAWNLAVAGKAFKQVIIKGV